MPRAGYKCTQTRYGSQSSHTYFNIYTRMYTLISVMYIQYCRTAGQWNCQLMQQFEQKSYKIESMFVPGWWFSLEVIPFARNEHMTIMDEGFWLLMWTPSIHVYLGLARRHAKSDSGWNAQSLLETRTQSLKARKGTQRPGESVEANLARW